MNLFDSHCHLDAEQFDEDREETIARAREAGVKYMVCIGSGYGPDDAGRALELAKNNDDMWATCGVHPHDAAKATREVWHRLRDVARDDKIVAWGEIGLDYYYDHSPREVQNQAFVDQLEIAMEVGLPVSLHVRDAATDTLVHLRDFKARYEQRLRGIWHCFTEDVDTAKEAVDLGFYISIPGIVTFPKGENVREVATAIPLEKLCIETDSPYLTPVPHRGKRNEPAFVVQTANKIAELKGVDVEEVARVTTRNAFAAYEIPEDEA